MNANRNSDSFCCVILHRMRDWDGYLQTRSLLGHGHMSHFTWAGSNSNEQKLLFLLIWLRWSFSFQHDLNEWMLFSHSINYTILRTQMHTQSWIFFNFRSQKAALKIHSPWLFHADWFVGFFSPGTMQLMLRCAVAWDPACVEIVCAKRLG